jgi:hypothetical protein
MSPSIFYPSLGAWRFITSPQLIVLPFLFPRRKQDCRPHTRRTAVRHEPPSGLIQMDQQDLAALVQIAQQLCVPFISSSRRVSNSVVLCRLAGKVIIPISNSSGERSKLTAYPAIQQFALGMYFMWMYDYFLTLGDEVRCGSLLSIAVLSSDRFAGDLCLVRNEISE